MIWYKYIIIGALLVTVITITVTILNSKSENVCEPKCNNGECNNKGKCVCKPGWTGPTCEIRQDDYKWETTSWIPQ